ncbi:MAG: RNA-guided endonuclease TnpB family protein [Limosilactobacillus sp.]
MIQSLTAKIRLYPTAEQAKCFQDVTEQYKRVCNVVSKWFFDNCFKVNRKQFNHEMYHDLRGKFPELNSAMVQSTYRTVEARYKTVKTQLKQHPYHFKDINTGQWYRYKRDLNWLRKPIKFKRPQADYVRNLNYSFVQKGTKISLNVLSQRIKVDYNDQYTQDWFDHDAHLGTAKLVQVQGHWFLHIPVTLEIDEWTANQNQHVVGIDRGLRQIMTTYDEHGRTTFFNGKRIAYQRRKYAYLRQQLQKAGTKSAKRHLKKLAHRENRWMSDVNHCLSKTLVSQYGDNTLFVIEDLQDVTFERERPSKDSTRELHSWSFYDLENNLTYKAQMSHSQVVKVSAEYTSQRCPRCGQIRKESRNHQLHQYHCPYCGFTTNDDRIGAMNLYELGKQYLNGNEQPKFSLTNVDD